MHRFFIPPEWIDEGKVTISGWLVHQLQHVLRLKTEDHILVLDNNGWEYEVELKRMTTERVNGKIIEKRLSRAEPRTHITLYQALLKGSKFEFVLQKCTELGVAAFVPTISDRCVVGNLADVTSGKIMRWKRITQEAAEQSGRGRLPLLRSPLLFGQACEQASGFSLIPWEGEKAMGLSAALKEQTSAGGYPSSVNLFIGPEGGFSDSEVEFARAYGIKPVSLGNRILRAETAAIAAVAAILYEYGDLGR
jgi:16S rRNA (uracil1498-N3)-methyltransferase